MILDLNAALKKGGFEPFDAAAMRAKILAYCDKGYIQRLSASEKGEKHNWYLPFFYSNNPGKIKIVFDAAAKINKVSLNSLHFSLREQTSWCRYILNKFRDFRVAVVGDNFLPSPYGTTRLTKSDDSLE